MQGEIGFSIGSHFVFSRKMQYNIQIKISQPLNQLWEDFPKIWFLFKVEVTDSIGNISILYCSAAIQGSTKKGHVLVIILIILQACAAEHS